MFLKIRIVLGLRCLHPRGLCDRCAYWHVLWTHWVRKRVPGRDGSLGRLPFTNLWETSCSTQVTNISGRMTDPDPEGSGVARPLGWLPGTKPSAGLRLAWHPWPPKRGSVYGVETREPRLKTALLQVFMCHGRVSQVYACAQAGRYGKTVMFLNGDSKVSQIATLAGKSRSLGLYTW